MLKNTQAIVLAAGKSTRLNTGNSKLLEKVCGQQIILYPLAILNELNLHTTVVVGFQKNEMMKVVDSINPDQIAYIEQQELTGTAAGLQLALQRLTEKNILVLRADVPLITADLLESLYEQHTTSNATISFITAHNGDPSGFDYSRIIKKENKVTIHRSQELSTEQIQEHCCINSGVYIIDRDFLKKEISQLTRNKATGEYHVSSLVNKASEQGLKVTTMQAPFDQIRGINTHQELWAVEQIKRAELIKYWMDRGVRFSSAQTVHMDLDVKIGAGTFIGSSVHLQHGTKIGSNCTVEPFSILNNAIIGDSSIVHSHTIIQDAEIGSHTKIGPFAHVHEKSTIGKHCAIGNFVETKRMQMGNHTKAKHLTYLGDAHIGTNVNIGAGTITCNFDGTQKHTTKIKDNVFIGTNNSLVAPVTIEKSAYTAAGSTITEDVPEKALAIARGRQYNKENYVQNLEAHITAHSEEKKETVSFIGAYKTHTDLTPKNQ